MKPGPFLKGFVAGAAGAIGMGIYNRLSAVAGPPPRSLVSGEARAYDWRGGRVRYQTAGPEGAPPLLLVHGIYATASSREMRKVHEHFTASYRLFTLDLPGFGLSDRPAIAYDDDLYVQFAGDFVRDVVGTRTAVIASSLSCSFVVAAAAARPDLFGPLVLIEPVGIEQLARDPGPAGALGYALFRSQVLGEFLFNVLVSRPGIRWFLKRQAYLDPALVTEEIVQEHYEISHQPNARFAPAAFVCGMLNRDIRGEFSQLRQPILLVWGYQSTLTPTQRATAFLQANPRAEIAGFDAKGLPHEEAAAAFNEEISVWLRRHWSPRA